MARKAKINIAALEKLGVEKLATLLFEQAQNDRLLKQTLTMALSAEDGVDAVANDIRKRLNAIARAGSFIDWRELKKFTAELEQQQMPSSK